MLQKFAALIFGFASLLAAANASVLKTIVPGQVWNIRDVYRLGGVIDIGTHSTLFKLHSGKFVLVDAVDYDSETLNEMKRIVGGDLRNIEALFCVHPRHTEHLRNARALFPQAKMYVTKRHKQLDPWGKYEDIDITSPKFRDMWEKDFEFSVPHGLEFNPPKEHMNAASVLVYHKETGTLHVDDTISYIRLPKVFEWLGMNRHKVFLHPAIPAQLDKHVPNAAYKFKDWFSDLFITSPKHPHHGSLPAPCQSIPKEDNPRWIIRNFLAAHNGSLSEAELRKYNVCLRDHFLDMKIALDEILSDSSSDDTPTPLAPASLNSDNDNNDIFFMKKHPVSSAIEMTPEIEEDIEKTLTAMLDLDQESSEYSPDGMIDEESLWTAIYDIIAKFTENGKPGEAGASSDFPIME